MDSCRVTICGKGFDKKGLHADNFLHQNVYVAWLVKGFGGPPLLILHSFYRQRMYVVLHRVHIATILRCVVAIT
jgi:hypothetical protein